MKTSSVDRDENFPSYDPQLIPLIPQSINCCLLITTQFSLGILHKPVSFTQRERERERETKKNIEIGVYQVHMLSQSDFQASKGKNILPFFYNRIAHQHLVS